MTGIGNRIRKRSFWQRLGEKKKTTPEVEWGRVGQKSKLPQRSRSEVEVASYPRGRGRTSPEVEQDKAREVRPYE